MGRGGKATRLSRRGGTPAPAHVAVLACFALVVLAAGCSPTFQRFSPPAGDVAAPSEWQPARPGAGIRFTTATGERYEGTILAVGDSIRVLVLLGPGPAEQSFARSEIARAEVRQQSVPGESSFGTLMLILMGAVFALYQIPWNIS